MQSKSSYLIKVIILSICSLFVFKTGNAQFKNLNDIIDNYDSYRTHAQKWLNENVLNSVLAGKIVIELPEDRTRYGTLTLGREGILWDKWDSKYPKMKCIGRSLSTEHSIKKAFKESMDESLKSYFENPQIGDYYGFILDSNIVKIALPTLTKNDLGGQGVILLIPQEKTDRPGILIHGGNLVKGQIPPGYGSIKLSKESIKLLVERATYIHAGLQGKNISDLREQFAAMDNWVKLDAYRMVINVTIEERKPKLIERIGWGKIFYKKGLSISEDKRIAYSEGYIDPIPVSSYEMVGEYYESITIRNEILLLKMMDELSKITETLDQYSTGKITGEVHISKLKTVVGDLKTYVNEFKLQPSIRSNEKWGSYITGLIDYLKYMKDYIRDWRNPNTISPNNSSNCWLVDTKCDIFVLQCQYECFGGDRYSEPCGICFIVAF